MEMVKNTAAVLGVLISAASVLAIVSKTVRGMISAFFQKYGKTDEVSKSIAEIKLLLEQHIEDDTEFKENIAAMNEISLEFTKAQCRDIIKTMFYKYNNTEILPLYEKKTLMNVEDIYVGRLNGNSFASLLLEEMAGWAIDYESSGSGEDG
jgi:hypothetical protein